MRAFHPLPSPPPSRGRGCLRSLREIRTNQFGICPRVQRRAASNQRQIPLNPPFSKGDFLVPLLRGRVRAITSLPFKGEGRIPNLPPLQGRRSDPKPPSPSREKVGSQTSLPFKGEVGSQTSLPFKGRVGVGMGLTAQKIPEHRCGLVSGLRLIFPTVP